MSQIKSILAVAVLFAACFWGGVHVFFLTEDRKDQTDQQLPQSTANQTVAQQPRPNEPRGKQVFAPGAKTVNSENQPRFRPNRSPDGSKDQTTKLENTPRPIPGHVTGTSADKTLPTQQVEPGTSDLAAAPQPVADEVASIAPPAKNQQTDSHDKTRVAISAIDTADEQSPAGNEANSAIETGRPKESDGIGNLIEGTREQFTSLEQSRLPQALEGAVPLPSVPPHRLTLEKKIAQMLVVGFKGTKPEQRWPTQVRHQLVNGQLGGVILLKYNLEERQSARRLMNSFLSASDQATHPAFLMLDQEGGFVQRLGPSVKVKKFPTPRTVAARGSEKAAEIYNDMAETLANWGFNVNLGPVVDLDINPKNPAIGKFGRSYSREPDAVVHFADIFIEAHRRHGILTALKHFPGHGSSTEDSHIGFTDVSRTWSKAELEPFRQIINGGKADMVMTAHVYLDRYDDAKNNGIAHPASLSKAVITGLLRQELGYEGVVISDDMEMGAIRKHYDQRQALIDAIMAGTDILVLSNSAEPDVRLPITMTEYIARAARKNASLRARIDESYKRIVALKSRLRGQIQDRIAPRGAEKTPDKKGLNNSSPISESRRYALTSERREQKGPTLVSPATIGASDYVMRQQP